MLENDLDANIKAVLDKLDLIIAMLQAKAVCHD
jgi:hypothetical protein